MSVLTKVILIITCCLTFARAFAHGLDDIPTFTKASIDVSMTSDEGMPGEFSYHYSVHNGATNTGNVWTVTIDVSTSLATYSERAFPNLKTTPLHDGGTRYMPDKAVDLAPYIGRYGSAVVPLGQRAPLGWSGGYSRDATARFAGLTPEAKIFPGETLAGFEIVSKHPPSLREMVMIAHWFHESDGDDPSEEEWAQVALAVKATQIKTIALGPSPEPSLGTHKHWNQFSKDIEQLLAQNWVSENSLATSIAQQVTLAKQAMDSLDGSLAKLRLQPIVDAINSAADESLTAEARHLILINIAVLQKNTLDTPVSFEPLFTITPEQSRASLSTPYEVLIKVVNTADKNQPIAGHPFTVKCAFTSSTGQNHGCQQIGFSSLGFSAISDSNGEVRITIDKPKPGKAVFDIAAFGGEDPIGQARVNWQGGADLVVPLFIPPIVQSFAGAQLPISEFTMNQGDTESKASITRYYLAATEPVDINSAYVVGQRSISALQAGEQTLVFNTTFTVPEVLPDGLYHLVACADADDTTIETDESNNCSGSELSTMNIFTLPMVRSNELPLASIADVNLEEGDDGFTAFHFPVSIDRADYHEVMSLDYQTVEGTALEGEDYEAVSGTLVFADNTDELSKTITVNVFGDTQVENDDTLSVVLSNPNAYIALEKSQGNGVVKNDDSDSTSMDCRNAFASPQRLWPPNHKFKEIHIEGVGSSAGIAFTTVVDAIYQDEPLNDVGDGDTNVDGRGIGESIAQLRQERSGLGDGRIYEIQFTASSESGDNCSGSVIVGVPHDSKQQPIDSGVRIDSTGNQ